MGAAWARHAMCESSFRVRFTLEQVMKAQRREQRYSSNFLFPSALDGGGCGHFTPVSSRCTGYAKYHNHMLIKISSLLFHGRT